MLPRASSLLIVLSTLLVGCTDDEPVPATPDGETDAAESESPTETMGGDGVCIPGQSVSCTCTGADVGVQVCLPDGSGYDACVCGGEDSTGGSSGTGEPSDTGDSSDTGEPSDTGDSSDTGSSDTDTGGSCGDGVLDSDEECDDGDADDDDECLATCVRASCGDGFVWAGTEACDDGNLVDDDGCTNGCTLPGCGDGIVQTGEECDDGNADDDDECPASCLPASCGDGFVWAGMEECDDGDADDGDGCPSTCELPYCGDGFGWMGVEGCDDGNFDNVDACLTTCEPATCGDGFVWSGVEACDDGNVVPNDGCSNACDLPGCGDGIVQAEEQCDDGDLDDTDACISTCALASCGDGHVRAGFETCDDGNLVDTDGCTTTCTPAACGDGIVWAGVEDCDDADLVDTDACLSDCDFATCGDGAIWTGMESCDDGNLVDSDACPSSCEPATCGDGFVRAGLEQCDDGNLVDADACTNACMLAACGDGILHASEQCDDGNLVDTDACRATCVSADCGDGVVWSGVEDCDDGNGTDADACSTTCNASSCGDGVLWVGVEACDDGNGLPYDGCEPNCTITVDTCPNGMIDPGEQCDDGDADNTDACTEDCELAACGDGFLQAVAGEACDDGNLVAGDGCDPTCEFEPCHCFDSTLELPVVDDARDIEVADLDEDGNLDLVVVGAFGNAVNLRFGDGAGGFVSSSFAAAGPNSVAVGDVDGDIDLDLVLIETSSLTVWLNDGLGGFTSTGVSVGASNPSGDLELADLDADGDLDAVAGTSSGSQSMRVYLGNGLGGFAAPSTVPVAYYPVDLEIVDVDADGHLDLSARTTGVHGLVAFGNGSGLFPAASVAGYAGPDGNDGAGRFGDVDEDGNLDWVVLGSGRSWVRTGTGFGSGVTTQLAPPQLVRNAGQGSDLRLVDLNADGHLDMLAIIAGDVVYKLGDGMGGFGGTVRAAGGTPGNPTDLAYGDLDGDGVLDVVTLVPSSDEAIIFWSAANPLAPGCAATCGNGTCGDGQVDLLAEACDGEAGCNSCAWLPPAECGNGIVTPGTLCYASGISLGVVNTWEAQGVDGADLDADGRNDLVLGMRDNQLPVDDNGYFGVYWDLGEGALQWSTHSTLMEPPVGLPCRQNPRVRIAQLNTNVDTIPDVVVSCYAAPPAWSNVVKAFGDGDTSFSGLTQAHDDVHSPLDHAQGDYDEDGHLDLVVASDYYGGQILLNQGGNGSFGPPTDYNNVAADAYRVGTGDANGDNDLDIFTLRETGTFWVFLGDGTGSFPDFVQHNTMMDEMAVVDIDDDGDLDAVGVSANGEVQTALNNGLAGFVIQGPYQVGHNNATSIDALDADADAALDVVVTSNGGVTILRGNGNGSFQPGVTIHAATGMIDTYIDDLNGDGVDDIVATRTSAGNGTLLVFLSDP